MSSPHAPERYSPPPSIIDPTDVDLMWLVSRASAEGNEEFEALSLPEILISTESIQALGATVLEAAGVTRLDSLLGSEASRKRYQDFIASLTLRRGAEASLLKPEDPVSALTMLHDAAEGNKEALLGNVRTYVGEVYGGVGQVSKVEARQNDKGEIIKDGQVDTDRQRNVLEWFPDIDSQLLAGVHAEGRTIFAARDRRLDGSLKGKALLEASAMSDKASREALDSWGFFLHTITVSLRSQRVLQDGTCEIIAVYLAGVDQDILPPHRSDQTEQEEIARQQLALENRFDIRVLRRMYTTLGVEGAESMGALELLDTPLVLPEGCDALDAAMLYDRCASEELGKPMFMGSHELWKKIGSPSKLTRQHYEAQAAESEARQQEYEVTCQTIVDRLVEKRAEATTPREAIRLIKREVIGHTVEQAIYVHKTVDASRYGLEAWTFIEEGRRALERGDDDSAKNFVDSATRVAKDPTCPTGDSGDKTDPGGKKSDTKDTKEKSDEACDYEHTGCYCCPYDDDGNRSVKVRSVRARRNANGTAECLRPACGAKLGSDGKPISKGGVYEKALAKGNA